MYEQAELQLREALAVREALRGEAHPDSSETRSYLAFTLMRAGRLQEAGRLVDICLDFQRVDPGPQHPDTLRTMACKAMILRKQKDYGAAQTLYQQVLLQQRELLGPSHGDTVRSLVGLGNVLFDQEDYVGAENYYRKALTFQVLHPGPLDPETLATRHNLGNSLVRREQYARAEPLLLEAATLRTRVLGPVHHLTMGTRFLLASCVYRREHYERAERMLLGIMADGRNMPPEAVGDILLIAMNRLSLVYQKTQRTDPAIALLRDLETLAGRMGRPNSRLALQALHNLGSFHNEKDQPRAALPFYERALDGYMQTLGSEHPYTLRTWADLAEIYVKLGLDENGAFVGQLWEITRRIDPDGSPAAFCGLAYGNWLLRAGRLGEAEDLLSQLYRRACQLDAPVLTHIREARERLAERRALTSSK